MLDYFDKTSEELKEWSLSLHPDDRVARLASLALES